MQVIHPPGLYVKPAEKKQREGQWRGEHQRRLIILGQAGDHVAWEKEETQATGGDSDDGNMLLRLEEAVKYLQEIPEAAPILIL